MYHSLAILADAWPILHCCMVHSRLLLRRWQHSGTRPLQVQPMAHFASSVYFCTAALLPCLPKSTTQVWGTSSTFQPLSGHTPTIPGGAGSTCKLSTVRFMFLARPVICGPGFNVAICSSWTLSAMASRLCEGGTSSSRSLMHTHVVPGIALPPILEESVGDIASALQLLRLQRSRPETDAVQA